MNRIVHPVILCGGSGTRLWPLSTPTTPKQFRALISDKNMISETAERVAVSYEPGVSFATPSVVGSLSHRALLLQTLPAARQILEPLRRNSAPAVAAACLAHGLEDLILILPADHSVRNVHAFHRAIVAAADAAARGAIATFGVRPTHAATDYGYIKIAGQSALNIAIAVERFVEKPSLTNAKAYIDAGTYFWNTGIFLFEARTMLAALATHAPNVLAGAKAAMDIPERRHVLLDQTAFEKIPDISIDSAVMEHADHVATVLVDMEWSDVGSYAALREFLVGENTENATIGPVVARNCAGSIVCSDGPIVTVSGVENLAVVATGSEVLIAPIDDTSAVKKLGAEAQKQRLTFGLPGALRVRTRDWLWNTFEVWSSRAWDSDNGGFVEQLTMDGEADRAADRRVHVQARQVFSFAKAIELRWPGAQKVHALVDQGIDYLDTIARHPEGGWVHMLKSDGSCVDDTRDLYDHAFLILAGATAYQVTGNATALRIADDAISFIDAVLKDDEHGGWFESRPPAVPRRANPHMHLLEAMMAYRLATGCTTALERAAEVVCLFECSFFKPANDIVAEYFDVDWRLQSPSAQAIWLPGHHYEWATLLYQYEQITGHDSGSWRRRLIARADDAGLDAHTGLCVNALRANASAMNTNKRLWHQLERFRASLLMSETTAAKDRESMLNLIFEHFLSRGPRGGWIDELDDDGNPLSKKVPASTLYHLVTSAGLIIPSVLG